MTGMNESAHPMIEPLDYAMTPQRAAEHLSGDPLALYSLIWRGALATQVEGPVLVSTVIDLVAGPSATPGAADVRLRIHGLDPLCSAEDDASWARLLPEEVLPMARQEGLRGNPLPDALRDAIEALGPGLLDGDGWRCHDDAACMALRPLLPAPATWRVSTVVDEPAYGFDRLLRDMASGDVGRPSTYADGIERTLKNDLLSAGEALQVAQGGAQLLARIDELAARESGAQRVDAEFSRDLGLALSAIEDDPSLAGATLLRFAQRALGIDATALAAWLDDLQIDGESLDAAMARAANSLPAADSWDAQTLPVGLAPQLLCKEPEALLSAREQLDRLLADADMPGWKALNNRQRAARRLHLLSLGGSLRAWLETAARDLLLRWWIDLAPQERALLEEEVSGCPAPSAGDRQTLAELVAGVVRALALPPLHDEELPA